MIYHYAVYDLRAREWDNYESSTAPSVELHLRDSPFVTLDDFKIELPQDAIFLGRSQLPQGPDAIIANWSERTHAQPAPPEEQLNQGGWDFRVGLGMFIGGLYIGSQLKR